MQKSIWKEASDYVTRSRRRAVWTRIVGVLACVVVFCTTYALILPALTLEQPKTLVCTYETLGVHQHTADCYDAEGNLICGYADFVVHTHDERCYDADGNLVCALPEIQPHTHNETCFEEASVLSCGLEESEGHIHTDECYQDIYDEDGNPAGRELLCGQEESEGHTHTDACYSLQLTQLCELEEIKLHTHTEDCYDADGALICGQLEIVEHIHTDACFVAAEEEETGAPYTYIDDTLAAEVTLAEDASLPEGAALTVQPIPSASLYSLDGAQEDGYEDLVYQAEEVLGQPAAGIVFYDISFYDSDGAYLSVQTPATVSLRFQEAVFPEGTEHVAVLHYAADGNLPEVLENVTVERDEETGAISAVTFETDGFSNFGIMPLAGTDTDAADSSSSFTLTYTYNGTEYTITFNIKDTSGKAIPGDYSDYNISATGATLYKFSEIAPPINDYVFSSSTCNVTTDPIVSVSTYGYYNGYSTNYNEAFQFYLHDPIQKDGWYSRTGNYTVTLTYTKNLVLDGGSFVIINQSGTTNYALTTTSTTVNNVSGLDAQPVSLNTGGQVTTANAVVWTFEAQTKGTYYISTTVDGVKKYLYLCETPYDSSNVDGRGSLTLSDSPQAITVTVGDGNIVTLTKDSSAVNLDSAVQDFWCYKSSDINSTSQFLLAELYQVGTVKGVTPVGTVINLFDYWINQEDEGQPEGLNAGINSGHALKFTQTGKDDNNIDLPDTANRWTGANGGVLQGIVQNALGEDGYPKLSNNSVISSSEESLAYLFDPTTENSYRAAHTNVGGLLQESSDGYYYYDCTQNYAYYDENAGRFTLYNDWGVQFQSSDGSTQQGMFFPLNDYPSDKNLSADNSGLNHYFGMTLTTRFVHRYDGHTNASKQANTTFEFSGDDDVWIFIDGVLVADLGGIHDRASVAIDFVEGKVTIDSVYSADGSGAQVTYFNDIFANTGVELQTNTDEDGKSYQTFKNNSYHVLKFYYLERGGNSSNLGLKYNLASYPPTGITKVNQYGEAVSDAEFKVYKATVNTNGTWEYNEADPVYTGTTDASGQMVFVDPKDHMPYTMDELRQMFGEYFVLKETTIPDGYRLVSDEIHLHISNNVLLCENTWDSGVWADTNLLVSAPNTIKLVNGNTVDAATSGKIFAVVLKYTGDDLGNATKENLEDENNWAPLYGTAAGGFVVLDEAARKENTDINGDFLTAAIYAANRYVESQNEFAIGSSGALEGIINGMPGDVSNYYYMLSDANKGKTEYTVAYYWTSASSMKEATKDNTYRVDADANGYAFDRVFGATINVPNLVNDLYAQKFNEAGEHVNGATFALYEVEEVEGTIYYLAKDNNNEEKQILLANCTYTTNQSTGVITGTDPSGTKFTITPYKVETAMTADDTDNKTNEDGTAIFSYVEAGTYYLREIAAPSGYELNETEVLVYVTDNALYANAGTEDDGITVARGPGYIAHPLNQFASFGDINNTLTWVYERMQITTTPSLTFTAFNNGDGWKYLAENKSSKTAASENDAYTVHLMYANDETNKLFNYEVNLAWYKNLYKTKYPDARDEEIEAMVAALNLTRRLYTTVGWSYYELYQDYSGTHEAMAAAKGAAYEELYDTELGKYKEIANLFSRAIFVQFTDPYADGNLEISKTVVPVTTTSFQFTLNLTAPAESTSDSTDSDTENDADNDADSNTSSGTENDTDNTPPLLTDTYYYQIYNVTYDTSGKETSRERVTSGSDITLTDEDGNAITYTGQITDGTASFTLTNNQVLVVENLPYGAGYTITETVGNDANTTGYTYTPQVSTNGAAAVEGASTTGALKWRADHRADTGENVCTIQYTNALLPLVKVKKVDSLTNKPLAGASFVLYYKDGNGTPYYYDLGKFKALIDDQSEATYARETPASGELLFASLKENMTYYLKEISAPAGYIPLDGEIQIKVDKSGNVTVAGIITNSQLTPSTEKDGNLSGTGYQATPNGQELALTVHNTPSFELPETGGTGTFSYTAAGTLLIVGSLLCGYIPARSRKKRSAQSHTPL